MLWGAGLLLLGGFFHVGPARRRLCLGFAAGVLALHLLAGIRPVLIWPSLALLGAGALALALRGISTLTLAASLATAGSMVLGWPAAVAAGLDPVAATGLGVGLMSALAAPGASAPAAALAGTVLGQLTLGHSFDAPATFAPAPEQFYQVLATACTAALALAPLRQRALRLRERLAP